MYCVLQVFQERLRGLGKLEKPGCGAHLYQGPCYRDAVWRLACQTSVPNVSSWDKQEKGEKAISQAPLQLWFKSWCRFQLSDAGSQALHLELRWEEAGGGGGQCGSTRGIPFGNRSRQLLCGSAVSWFPRSRQWWCDLAAAYIQTFLFQKAKVVSASCSPPCLSSFRTLSHNTHLMWLVWNLALPTVIQSLRLGLTLCTCHLALPLVGQTSCSNPMSLLSLHPSILGHLGLATPL